jgi:hypothetical protein
VSKSFSKSEESLTPWAILDIDEDGVAARMTSKDALESDVQDAPEEVGS